MCRLFYSQLTLPRNVPTRVDAVRALVSVASSKLQTVARIVPVMTAVSFSYLQGIYICGLKRAYFFGREPVEMYAWVLSRHSEDCRVRPKWAI